MCYSVSPPSPPAKKNTNIYTHRAGEAELAELALPTRKQEPYRYTDLESLYRTDFTSGSDGAAAATAEAIKPFLLEASKGQQMVFVNGLFSEELSDVSGLGGVEGLVAGHVGEMEGAALEQVCVCVCVCVICDVIYVIIMTKCVRVCAVKRGYRTVFTRM